MEVLAAEAQRDVTSHGNGLEKFRRQYLQMLNFKELEFPDGAFLKAEDVQHFLYKQLFADDRSDSSYKIKVLRHVIESIEGAFTDPMEDELSEELYNEFSRLMQTSHRDSLIGGGEPQESLVTFTPPTPLHENPSVVIRSSEMTNVISVSGGTGHRTWEASLHLGSFLCTERGRKLTRNKTVLELGAGKGLVSYICLSYLGARQVYPTDGDANCVDRLICSPAPNGNWSPIQLIWDASYQNDRAIPELDLNAQGNLDLILGADITFDTRLMPDLARTICHLLKSNANARALIAATLRNVDTFEAFQRACVSEGLNLMVVDFECPKDTSAQTGLFHSHDTPIALVDISLGRE